MFIIQYFNGERWVTLSSTKRFWEPRRYTNKENAEAAIKGFQKECPGFMKFKVLRAASSTGVLQPFDTA